MLVGCLNLVIVIDKHLIDDKTTSTVFKLLIWYLNNNRTLAGSLNNKENRELTLPRRLVCNFNFKCSESTLKMC